jgi:hypothetical protein
VKFFTSLVLDCVGITLQVIDVLVQAIIFLLKLLHLFLEQLCFLALVGEGRETVMAKDDAIGHDEGKGGCREGRATATPQIETVLRSLGELGQFDGEFRFGWCGSQFQASMGS